MLTEKRLLLAFLYFLLVIIYISSFESEYMLSKSNNEQLGEQTTTN